MRNYASLNSWMLGYADSAGRRMAETIALARAIEDPYEIAFARFFESLLHCLLRDASRATTAARQALALSEEHGFSWPKVALARNPGVGASAARQPRRGSLVDSTESGRLC